MSEEMIEKVARAIHDARFGYEYQQSEIDEMSLKLARAALSAYNPNERLREALEAIREAVSKRQLPITNEIYELADAALSPLPQEMNNVR